MKTPLSIIALFVALIEAFLAYPVTQIQGTERLILVVFMTGFPFFVAACFFLLLWHRPRNLYSPGEIAEANALERATAAEIRLEELEEQIRQLRVREMPAGAAVLAPSFARQLAAADAADDVEAAVRAGINRVGKLDASSVAEVKREVKQTRQDTRRRKAEAVREAMGRFRHWLAGRGFTGLPDLPRIVIDAPDLLNAYYDPADRSAHFGERISDDVDTVAHTYFHVVLDQAGVLTEFEGETAALIEALCDYFACSYADDSRMGEGFAAAAGMSTGWIRNLAQLQRIDETPDEPHARSVVWSGACWELRERYGADKVDAAVREALAAFGARAGLGEAAGLLRDRLAASDPQAGDVVRQVFEKRGVALGDSQRPSTSRARPRAGS